MGTPPNYELSVENSAVFPAVFLQIFALRPKTARIHGSKSCCRRQYDCSRSAKKKIERKPGMRLIVGPGLIIGPILARL
jgi:hypothetical protein